MTANVAQVQLTNTWDFWRQRTNDLINYLANSIITTGNTNVGDVGLTGNLYCNTATSNVSIITTANVGAATVVSLTSNTANLVSVSSNNVSSNNGTVVVFNANTIGANTGTFVSASGNTVGANTLNANTEVVNSITYKTAFTGSITTLTATVVDSFPIASFHGGEYLVSLTDNSSNNFSLSKVLVLQDGTKSYVTEYGQLVSNNLLGVFSTSSNATSIILSFTSASSTNITYKIDRSLLHV